MTNTVYVGVTNRTGGSVSGVYRRPEDRDTWEFCDAIKDTHVHALAVHPGDPAVVYAATSRGLLRSDDRGTTWTCVVESDGREQMWSVLFHPKNPQTILAGTPTHPPASSPRPPRGTRSPASRRPGRVGRAWSWC